jgi:NADPH:quinone reductase
MRAIQIQRFGGPEVLELAELPRPETGPGQLLVKVEHAGINWADMGAREDCGWGGDAGHSAGQEL